MKTLILVALLAQDSSNLTAAVERMKAKDYKGAVAEYTKALDADPKLVQAWIGRAEAKRYLSDPEGALVDLTKAIELVPGNAAAYARRAAVRASLKDYDEAIVDYDRALKEDAQNWRTVWGRASAREATGAEFSSRQMSIFPRITTYASLPESPFLNTFSPGRYSFWVKSRAILRSPSVRDPTTDSSSEGPPLRLRSREVPRDPQWRVR